MYVYENLVVLGVGVWFCLIFGGVFVIGEYELYFKVGFIRNKWEGFWFLALVIFGLFGGGAWFLCEGRRKFFEGGI